MTGTVLVTGSTAGIGLTTAEMIAEAGHRVILHARDYERAEQVRSVLDVPVVVGDLASLAETQAVAEAVRSLGAIDAVVHNAGIYESGARTETVDGLERTFQVNVLAPYLLTALIPIPSRLIYLSSGMASEGEIVLDDLQRERRRWSATGAYQDSKLCEIALAQAMARRFPKSVVTAVCPGWVRTRMGGAGAPTDVRTGSATQVWLATSDDPAALRSGRFMRHMRELPAPAAATDLSIQDGLLETCTRLSGADLPNP
ncbi:MAG TPA: SDR family NAD(P)-dependent oxidoreductase [Acidimicrobiia bacterium]|nr:SDR family NAD(P)-dependent oxidoreductase [Acidimicrobiia bacterium]